MRKKWISINKRADFNAIGEKYNIDPVIAKIVTNRGITAPEELDAYFADVICPPKACVDMLDLEKGAGILLEKIKQKEKILVIGDYDADGVCSTAILVKAIRFLGGEVSYKIPDRIEDGYGMNEQMVDEAKEAGISCIITCDNGISAFAAAECAKEFGISVVITDHHSIPYDDTLDGRIEIIPMADAVIDPKQESCLYPFKEICGAVVALRFAEKMMEISDVDFPDKTELYDLAAIATVTDVMPLIGENRQLVKYGLNNIPHSKNLGLRTLCKQRLSGKKVLTGFDIGFVIGPCINATGRVSTADKAVRLLLTEDENEASLIAQDMAELNEERKALTRNGAKRGLEIASTMPDDKVLVVYMPELHESIAGLVAGRIKENTGKPVLVITGASTGAKGSGRSIEEYSMIDEITKCKDLLTKFGGHPMAAGFSLPVENIDALRRRLNENCSLELMDLCPKIKIDAAMPFGYVTESLISQLEVLEPTGKGNEAPVFALKDVGIARVSFMGKEKRHLRIVAEHENRRYQLVLFSKAEEFISYIRDEYGEENMCRMLEGRPNPVSLCISYRPQINDFWGKRSIQFIVDQYQ